MLKELTKIPNTFQLLTFNFQLLTLTFSLFVLFSSCEKNINLDLPAPEDKIVIEGTIEPHLPPIIMVSHNTPYFASVDINTYKNLFIHNADVRVNGVKLTEINLTQINDSINNIAKYLGFSPDSLRNAIKNFIGITLYDLTSLNFYIYTTADTSVWGKAGKTYNLQVNVPGKATVSSVTTIPTPLKPDSIWFVADDKHPGEGYMWLQISDPANEDNYYRMFTLRLNKDKWFIPNIPSIINDKLFNGKTISAQIRRGEKSNSTISGLDFGRFAKGDTVIVKFSTIDHQTYEFWNSAETDIRSNGSPFSTPSNIRSNITNGLGIWSGYGSYYKIVIFK
ncbi:MAG: DUF4249 domain-containing protein [Bacteroidota bacterium]|nr:DUF4249 domain-containing protein [Bacteroidota bacterium]